MTPLALTLAPARPARFSRLPLAAKLAFGFVGLVALVLIVNGAIDAFLSYSQAKRAALEVQGEKARAAAERVGVFLDEIQTQLGWTAGVEWGYAKLEQQRYDFIRLLRQAPAITALAYLDGKGKEQLGVSRLEPDAVASAKDFSADPRFVRAVADKVWFGPVEFRRGSEPYMTVALAHVGKTPGVTVADVNLKLVWDVVSAIHVGDKGFAYVVDDKGRLIAHPDLSLVLRDTDFSHLPQVAAALKGAGAGTAEAATSRDGAAVLTAYAIAPKTHWAVFVEQPLSEALATAYRSLMRSLALLGLGLALAAVSGVALARRMAAPIRLLQAGAEKLGAGDLSQRLDIRTGDEIEALAGGFNRMAGQLQESYENLEGKVEARTKDLNEALAQQTATAEILRVIAASPSDMRPVFDALADRAMRLLGAWSVAVYRYDGEQLHFGAARGGMLDSETLLRSQYPRRPDSAYGRCIAEKAPVAVIDELANPDSIWREYAMKRGFRSHLTAPMLANGEIIGLISVTRQAAGAFSDEDTRLLTSFADQAAIAINNVNQIKETEESLAQQTATAEILRVIAASPSDVQPVFEAVAERAMRLLGGWSVVAARYDGDQIHFGAARGASPDSEAFVRATFPFRPDPLQLYGRCIEQKAAINVPDGLTALDLETREYTLKRGFRAVLVVPMLTENQAIGLIAVTRQAVGAFSDRDIRLLTSFADQAAIAIRNVGLFSETQQALAQQTATADVLKIISRSAFDLDAIFQTLVATAVDLCSASSGTLCVRDGEVFRYRGMAGPEATLALQNYLSMHPLASPTRQTIAGRAILSRQTEEIEDVLAESDYAVPFAAHGSPARSLLGVPLLGKAEVLGAIVVARAEPGAFPSRHVEILRTFADQAVIAIENSRLFDEVQARTRELETSLSDLRKAQDRLVQSEKLASLGQLTAGIAHEIKNPLNFVNNFATLSRELLGELREALGRLPDDAKADADDLMGMLDSNLDKVAHHGKRADSIVKNMLLHSREGSGERASVSVNAMVEEALNLGYHGARAEKPGFNVAIEKTFDPQAGEADLHLQEITRVLLNLVANAFYATAKRREGEGPDYQPTVTASTRSRGRNVEIRIRDNGAGIPEDVRAKMFNPFFTTKPAGEGTGLGLSLSHDIIVKQHEGTIDVETEAGAFTEFIITLPRAVARA